MNHPSTKGAAANPKRAVDPVAKATHLHKVVAILRKQITQEQKVIADLKEKAKFLPKMNRSTRPSANLEESTWFECLHHAREKTPNAISKCCHLYLDALETADTPTETETSANHTQPTNRKQSPTARRSNGPPIPSFR